MRLAASCRARLSAPSRNGFLGEPDHETASLTQTGVVLRPIRDLVPLLRNAVTASGIGFEWHGRESVVRGRTGLYATQPRLPTRLSMQQSDPVPLSGNAITASGIGIERHDRIFGQKPNRLLRYPAALTNLLIH